MRIGLRKWKRVSFLVVALILFAALAHILVSSPALFRSPWLEECGCEPGFIVLNPLRNRRPERVAGAFLELLKRHRCEEAMASVLEDSEEHRECVCTMEREHALGAWKLRGRADNGTRVKLFFWHWSEGSNATLEAHGEMWVTVEKRLDGWAVTDFDVVY
jgi:hypothetical protein